MCVCSYCFLSAAPSGAPRNVHALLVSSRNITVAWDPIACTGEITGYIVQFYKGEGVVSENTTTNRNFTATELRPFTNYSFQVAGFSTNGTGPFTETTNFTTREDSNIHVCMYGSIYDNLQFLELCPTSRLCLNSLLWCSLGVLQETLTESSSVMRSPTELTVVTLLPSTPLT